MRSGDLVLFTSGSTGRPRGVVRSVQSWRASLEPLTALTGICASDVVWIPGPLSSSLFLYGAWHATTIGATVRVDPVPRPDVTVVHAVPTLLARALDAAAAGALPALRSVVVAGDALPSAQRDRVDRLGWRLLEYYGAAELSFVGWRRDGGPFLPFPGVRTLVTAGRLHVHSPYVARGYLDPDDPGPLSTRVAGDGTVWRSVGDLAEPAGEDGFHLLGRAGAAVTTGGSTVLASEVEAVLRQVPGVRDVAVLGVPHPDLGEVVAAVLAVGAGGPAAELRRDAAAAASRLPAAARPRRWYVLADLPRTISGKVDQPALRERVLAGRAAHLR